ncbi:DNA pilot protein [Microviridae sp.]|nr:DNA pilot protein [Microviridae sp.]
MPLGAIAGLAGGIVSARSAAKIAGKNRRFAEHQAQINRQFQRRMSNTAYQRQMRDLKRSGLNPMLAVAKMGGASTPPGAQAQHQADEGRTAKAIQAGVAIATAKENLNLMRAQKGLTDEKAEGQRNANVKSGIEADMWRKGRAIFSEVFAPELSRMESSAKREFLNWFKPNPAPRGADIIPLWPESGTNREPKDQVDPHKNPKYKKRFKK